MYHSLLIHSSADGHLGGFHVLAIINSAVMNTGVHVSLSILVSSVCMPSVGLLGHLLVGMQARQLFKKSRHYFADKGLYSQSYGFSSNHIWMWELDLKKSKVAQSCPTLCNPMDYSPPGSSVHGILQTRILEWVAISFSRGSSWPRDRTQVFHIAGRRFNLWPTGDYWAHSLCQALL